MIRTFFVYVYALIITPYHASRALWAAKRRSNASCACEEAARVWSQKLVRASGVTIEVTGIEGVDLDKPHIIISNHQSWFDVFAIAGFLPTRLRFVAKAELSRIPIFGPAWVECGHVSIDRKDHASAVDSITEAGRRMKDENLNIVVFPEGTRSIDGRLKPFKKGAFVLAIQTGVPILPVAVCGSWDVMPKGQWRIRPGHIQVRVGRPIPVEGLDLQDRDTLLETAWDAVDRLKNDKVAADTAA